MRILLVGRGHLGTILGEKWSLSGAMWWKGDMAELGVDSLRAAAPDIVVNCAGKTDLPWCEANARECFRCNVEEPARLLDRVTATFGGKVPMFHLSSGCVWEGPYDEFGMPFHPEDPPTPTCMYAWSKAACDAVLLQRTARRGCVVILRPRQVYSPAMSPRNTFSKLLDYEKLLDTPNSMTSADTIARTIERLAARGARGSLVVNVYDRGATSPYKVGMMLAERGLRRPPAPLTKDELDSWHKPKRVDAVLHDDFFEDVVDPPTIGAELGRNMDAFARNFATEADISAVQEQLSKCCNDPNLVIVESHEINRNDFPDLPWPKS
jgi:dTDP-4-dehydrorhamnose reductase